MRRFMAVLLVALFCGFALFACSSETEYKDGTYRAEYSAYDTYGYKAYLVVTVQGGVVTAMEFDAVMEDGSLKSQDENYQKDMESVQGTYPAKYSADLVNQYLTTKNINEVDDIAGATEASQSFKSLFAALEPSMISGNTATVVI